MKEIKLLSVLSVLSLVLIGMFSGLGVFTFGYGEGLSYFSKDPRACTNCHIMQPQFDSWQKASHHTAANCVDCHLPHAPLPKLMAKAENGFWHSKGFTLQDFHEPIFIRKKNTDILQDNCLYCHKDFVHNILPGPNNNPDDFSCIHCHRSVGHGETIGLGKYEPANNFNLYKERSHDE